MSSQDNKLSHRLPVAVPYLWGGHKRVSLWVGIIATCEIPVVRRNYCVFLSFLYVLPVKERNTLLRSKGKFTSRCPAVKTPSLDFGIGHCLWEMFSERPGMFSSLKYRLKTKGSEKSSRTLIPRVVFIDHVAHC